MYGSERKLLSIPFGKPFIKSLAEFVIQNNVNNPQNLKDLRIILPNKRGCLNFYHALIKCHKEHYPHIVLPHPKVIALRDILLLTPELQHNIKAIPLWAQKTFLVKLVQKYFTQHDKRLSFNEVLIFTDSLADILNEWALNEKNKADIDFSFPLVGEHRLYYTDFLEFLIEQWPILLSSMNLLDEPSFMIESIKRVTTHWEQTPPLFPVMIAGTTGTVPATRRLIQTVLGLTQGVVILPGYSALLSDEWQHEHHPQHRLHFLKEQIGFEPHVIESLNPPHEKTTLTCDDLNHEAWTISCLVRQHFDQNKKILIVTNHKELGEKILRCLDYWHIHTNLSTGKPYIQSPFGQFIKLTFSLFDEPDLATLLSVLKHPFVQKLSNNLDAITGFEKTLRFSETLAYFKNSWDVLNTSENDLINHLAIFRESYPFLKDKIIAYQSWLTPYVEQFPDLGIFCHQIEQMLEYDPFIPSIRNYEHGSFIDWILSLCKSIHETSGLASHVDIVTPFEGRLHFCDVVILAGLNEGSWPTTDNADAWIGDMLKKHLGLASTNKKIGYAAYDFQSYLSCSNVYATRSITNRGTQEIPSRFFQELSLDPRTKIDQNTVHWARTLFESDQIRKKSTFSAACPPVHARPRRLSATAVEHLMRDPYGHYAKYILKLRPILRLSMKVDAKLKGMVIHRILQDHLSSKPTADYEVIIHQHLKDLFHHPAVHFYWKVDIKMSLLWLEDWRMGKTAIRTEQYFDRDIGPITFHATTDAVFIDDAIPHIIDFKTGTVPTLIDCKNGFSPQVPIEGWLYPKPSKLSLIQLSGDSSSALTFKSPEEYIQLASEGLSMICKTFYEDQHPYISVPIDSKEPRYNPYSHLERRDF